MRSGVCVFVKLANLNMVHKVSEIGWPMWLYCYTIMYNIFLCVHLDIRSSLKLNSDTHWYVEDKRALTPNEMLL